MSKLLAFIFILLVACSAYAGQAHFSAEVSVTDTNTNTSITGLPGGGAQSVTIINDGTDDVYFNLNTGVATATGAGIKSGEVITVTSGGGEYPITNVGLICASASTATVRIFAFPSK